VDNPLLDLSGLPRFDRIRAEHVVDAIERVLSENRITIGQLLAETRAFSWETLVEPLEDLADRINRVWSPVAHLNAVVNSEALRDAYLACLPELSAYATELGQNVSLYRAYLALAESPEYERMQPAQRKAIDNALRDFRLSGVALSDEDKARYREVVQELATLTAKFQQNLLDATDAWTHLIDDERRLAGLPPAARALARDAAARHGDQGWLITLEFPSYTAVMTHADDRELRREVYTAYVTRASDEGPHAGKYDNTPIMERILALRHEEARLLGFANYAERSLATKMASDTRQVIEFLRDLARRSLPVARTDLAELQAYARDHHGLGELEAWDVAYCSEKLREYRYAISQEALKAYFPVDRVLTGMFGVITRLYGMQVVERNDISSWHPQVRFFEVSDSNGVLRGQFYLDLYARANKRGGAWMDECIVRKRRGQRVQTPVAYLTCNFTPPVGGDPALLTHQEVLTLFHEFGHGLHHMLTQVDQLSVSGIQGVAWDAVELPSQFMENWCWQRETLPLISGHYQGGVPLPEDLFERLLEARNFQSGMQTVRQLEFALFDFRLHLEYDPGVGAHIYPLLEEVRREVAVLHPPSFNRFPHSFAHIFAGGYAAGYYSYKWAEVLASDAFSLFEEKGIFDMETGLKFLNTVLEQGGSRDAMELFIDFRGREPQIDALLRHSGLAA